MNNPIHCVKNTRQSYNRFKGEVITEVQVQFDKEDPAWIPYSTLLDLLKTNIISSEESRTPPL